MSTHVRSSISQEKKYFFPLSKVTAPVPAHLLANCDETQASPHFRFVNINFRAFVHCSSELNWILENSNI